MGDPNQSLDRRHDGGLHRGLQSAAAGKLQQFRLLPCTPSGWRLRFLDQSRFAGEYWMPGLSNQTVSSSCWVPFELDGGRLGTRVLCTPCPNCQSYYLSQVEDETEKSSFPPPIHWEEKAYRLVGTGFKRIHVPVCPAVELYCSDGNLSHPAPIRCDYLLTGGRYLPMAAASNTVVEWDPFGCGAGSLTKAAR